ncbi:ATP-binding protein [Amylibacter sp.]|nr:ATP-binding protein [Amylibacter sp.]
MSQKYWPKNYLPKSLLGRSILILAIPILLIQAIITVIFIDRLYGDVTISKTSDIARELNFILNSEIIENDSYPLKFIHEKAQPLSITVNIDADPKETKFEHTLFDISGRYLIKALKSQVVGLKSIDLRSDETKVKLIVNRDNINFIISLSRRRATAENPHQLLVAGFLASCFFIGIAVLFLKNQVRPIRILAKSAESFGKGEKISFSPSGATEVRQAGHAFISMRARIERHLEQRTAMLSGVSHDLRTPLTRMKLSISLMEKDDLLDDLQGDVKEMEDILNEFLAFSRGDSGEEFSIVDPKKLIKTLIKERKRLNHNVSLNLDNIGSDKIKFKCKALAISRAINNLLSNAAKHSEKTIVSVKSTSDTISFIVEDSGKGIPKDLRQKAIRPFERLDTSRNQNKGIGAGLGLAIVSDIARSHGGKLILNHSNDLGGLRAEIQIPL